MSANLYNAAGSLSPSLVERRMVSAMDCTCDEFTGSGSDATAASSAILIMLMVSGGNDAFEKSFISRPIGLKDNRMEYGGFSQVKKTEDRTRHASDLTELSGKSNE